ncbi:hypothetical protein PF005_g30475 [Phytophthora fragariae]|uniref:Uncharacterized protein n=1 Tax=Phytophthora fragariae TaxID=53985 RepID=A0A6A3VDM4_9STRA|nr:hypothetical protein PF003_g19938 [Phytophthora fragariae]KAE9061670.1 hypothetical protein PF007_g30175 [Phytophthora fragariae]KAE9163375.1 hypothetical protein PF005_g30475 [Phytophthora fragariae]KAE9165053.1 hypothetical protein PF004_g29627 [Phytophthora fragariae]KAE9171198.1 hypothetical protein PF002_g29886 [Phytophthora fragariae]
MLVAVSLYRWRQLLSCCSASSSATVPIRPLLSCYSATGSSSATAPIPSISFMLRC